MLKKINWFFVQNEESVSLLKQLNLENVSIAGDTRFDRVAENAAAPAALPLIRQYCSTEKVFIAGSTWPADEVLIQRLTVEHQDWKFILVPHEIYEDHLKQIEKIYPTGRRFSTLNEENIKQTNVLIIDNIGMLSSIYQYGGLAYIGGGFGVGIHNTLEAAAYGLPIIFGPNYRKFQEAHDLIKIGAAISIDNEEKLITAFQLLKDNQKAGMAANAYVKQHQGATETIYQKIKSFLLVPN